MGVTDGTPVDSATTNPAFLDANADDSAQGKISFANTDAPSGPTVTNIQREVNSLNAYTGRPAGSAYNANPAWTNNQVGSNTNNLKARAEALTLEFDNISGHTHDGTQGNGGAIAAPDLTFVPLSGYVIQGVNLTSITGSSTDVSSLLVGQTPSNSSVTEGIVVNVPYNKIILRQATGANAGDAFTDPAGNIVYARLTYLSSVWTLSYYVDISGTETPYTFIVSSDIAWYYQQLYNPMVNPPVYSSIFFTPSDNSTADVQTATTTLQGKVQLATAAQPIASSSSAGTANATVANANHTHEGVHKLFIGLNNFLGDVELEAGTGISISNDGGKIKFENISTGSIGFQQILTGTVDGSNTTFGPTTYLPSDNNSALVFIDAVPQVLGVDYTLSAGVVTFTVAPSLGQTPYCFYLTGGAPTIPVLSGTYRVEYRTISSGEETAKALTLIASPGTSNFTSLDVIGGGPQFYSDDFTVSGSALSWGGLGLDGVLVAGDKVRITYVS